MHIIPNYSVYINICVRLIDIAIEDFSILVKGRNNRILHVLKYYSCIDEAAIILSSTSLIMSYLKAQVKVKTIIYTV